MIKVIQECSKTVKCLNCGRLLAYTLDEVKSFVSTSREGEGSSRVYYIKCTLISNE